jgi:hypothetical protein
MWYSTPEFIIPLQSTYISTLILEVCFTNIVLKLQKLSPLGSPHVAINMNKKTKIHQEFKIQTLQMSNGLFLYVMSCKPKNYVICLFS